MNNAKVRAWYHTPQGWRTIDQMNLTGDRRTQKRRLSTTYVETNDPDVVSSLRAAVGGINDTAKIYVLWAPSLREALTTAKGLLPEGPARDHLQRLLDQKSDEYGTLVDECQVAIYG